jgi:hypothetical protein
VDGAVPLSRQRGVTRRVERRGPPYEHDQHGKLAEDALIEALAQRRASEAEEITLDTRIATLVDQHIDRLIDDGRSVRTVDTYRYAAKLLAKIIAGVRVGESTPARIDAAIRSMRRAAATSWPRSLSGLDRKFVGVMLLVVVRAGGRAWRGGRRGRWW